MTTFAAAVALSKCIIVVSVNPDLSVYGRHLLGKSMKVKSSKAKKANPSKAQKNNRK